MPAPPAADHADVAMPRWMWWALGALVGAISLATAWHYNQAGLTLSHYDAKGHLVVARRIIDSLTPGWRQVGAVWLPLPHLLNALPVQIDAVYRTGASAVLLSMACLVLTSLAVGRLVAEVTDSRAAAVAAIGVLVTDPNVLYLQSTPMTEPLLFACLAMATLTTYRWLVSRGTRRGHEPGLWMAAACWTRYEAWPVTAVLLALSALAMLADTRSLRATFARVGPVAAWPIGALVLFSIHSRATIGEWVTTGGFFVPENRALGKPLVAAWQVIGGLTMVVGRWPVAVAAVGLLSACAVAWRHAPWRLALVAVALFATAALPFYAFVSGHPFRVRYMVVLVVGLAVWNGLAVAVAPRRLRALAAIAVVLASLADRSPWSTDAPMVREAQWDRPNIAARRTITACLSDGFSRPDHKILASMGSLAHYMHELSNDGFVLDDFVHEGIGDLWGEFLADPHPHVEWILFNEYSEGGDELTRLRKAPGSTFVDGFARVCEGGGLALYRRAR